MVAVPKPCRNQFLALVRPFSARWISASLTPPVADVQPELVAERKRNRPGFAAPGLVASVAAGAGVASSVALTAGAAAVALASPVALSSALAGVEPRIISGSPTLANINLNCACFMSFLLTFVCE